MAKATTNGHYKSGLGTGAERFLSAALVRAFEDRWRTAEDFIRVFPPPELMDGLGKAPDLRASLLVTAAGVHEKIARKKSTAAAAEDLQLALDEGVTTPADVVAFIPPDERVRNLDHKLLWKFVTEEEFWKKATTEAIGRVIFLLEMGLDEGLMSLQDVADGLTFREISLRLPEEDVRKLLEHALSSSRSGRPLDEQSLLEIVALPKIIEYVPLDNVWDRVIIDKIARPCGFVAGGDKSDWKLPPVRPSQPPKAAATSAPSSLAASPAPASVSSGPPPLPTKHKAAATLAGMAPLEPQRKQDEDERGALKVESARLPHEEQARRRVTDRLKGMDRLPPGHDQLTLPVLLSIESMYAELLTLTTEEQRESCIRESFPNETHMRTAMLALIDLLDPSINTRDPIIRDGDIDSLIKVVLFEERRRFEEGKNPAVSGRSGSSPAPPVTSSRRAVVAPPARRVSAPPVQTRTPPSNPAPLELDVEVNVDEELAARGR